MRTKSNQRGHVIFSSAMRPTISGRSDIYRCPPTNETTNHATQSPSDGQQLTKDSLTRIVDFVGGGQVLITTVRMPSLTPR